MKKKLFKLTIWGFTLIEIIGVIILLGILALLVFPALLRTVRNSNTKVIEASKSVVLTAATRYVNKYDDNFKSIDGSSYCLKVKDLIAENYITKSILNKEVTLETSVKVKVNDDKFEYEITKDCQLLINETTKPTIDLSVVGNPFNENGWANSDFFVKVDVTDNESGAHSYNWCVDNKECEPSNNLKEEKSGNVVVSTESKTVYICAYGYDLAKNQSLKKCIGPYQLDKQVPILNIAYNDIKVMAGEDVLVSTYFNPTYGISGEGSMDCSHKNTNQFVVGNYEVVCKASGKNGLTNDKKASIKVLPVEYDYVFNNSVQEHLIQRSGTYKLELWGSQGSNNGGKGGYISSEMYLEEDTILSMIIGGTNGYNGGGTGVYNGGGATTITMNSKNLLIAGGGGGGTNGTAGGSDNGIGGASVGSTAGVAGVNGGGGGSSANYDYSCNCSTCGGGCASYYPTYSCGCSTCGGGCASYYPTYSCGCSTCGGGCASYNPTYDCNCSTCGGGCASYAPTYSCGCSTCGGGCAKYGCGRVDAAGGCHNPYCASYYPTYSCNCKTCGGGCNSYYPTYSCNCSTCGGGCASYNPTYECGCSTCGGGCASYAPTYSCGCSTCGGGCASYNPTYECNCSTCTTNGNPGKGGASYNDPSLLAVTKNAGINIGNGKIKITYLGGLK